MAKLKLPSVAWNEGSLLRRTLLHVIAFVIGSAGFVALSSLLLLWVARSVLPSRHAPDSTVDTDKPGEIAPATASKPRGPAGFKGRRGKTPAEPPPEAAEAPAPASDAR